MDVDKRQPQRQLRWAWTASFLFLVSALLAVPYTSVDAGRRNLRSLGGLEKDPKTVELKSTPNDDPAAVGRGDSFLQVGTLEDKPSGHHSMLFTPGGIPEERVLFLIANHLMPPVQGRLRDMVSRYEESFAHYPNIDFKYVWTNNFQGTDPEESINDSIMTFTVDEVQYLKSICPYCAASDPWNWSNYASVVLATRQLMQKGIEYDKVWYAEPDAEFVGDIGGWVSFSTRRFSSLDLVSSLTFYDLKTATEVLPSAGMFARIQPNSASEDRKIEDS
ncbi:hypothetical protein THAOC_02139 [Thalassiosira oceanica]|uniref:Uncharacterized protein n=1 Tax=Thalassiosira oceanica TaxID=159749 RepID=K0TFE5_THAOC|nr:hypothetical protein THAOC_02139 [Thalassiosira oceanica]|eukprot:EJK76115.1 hypothetical protein THAOC_02139 [Thalassiosira oceanica]